MYNARDNNYQAQFIQWTVANSCWMCYIINCTCLLSLVIYLYEKKLCVFMCEIPPHTSWGCEKIFKSKEWSKKLKVREWIQLHWPPTKPITALNSALVFKRINNDRKAAFVSKGRKKTVKAFSMLCGNIIKLILI